MCKSIVEPTFPLLAIKDRADIEIQQHSCHHDRLFLSFPTYFSSRLSLFQDLDGLRLHSRVANVVVNQSPAYKEVYIHRGSGRMHQRAEKNPFLTYSPNILMS